MTVISRRAALGAVALLVPAVANAATESASQKLKALEQSSGARIGLAVTDTANGNALIWREAERFMLCSTFKLSLAAAILARIDNGAEQANRVIRYGKGSLLDVSPATTRNQATGMRVVDLCEAIAIYSDNTAANLLLEALGGPAELTRFWRGLGDRTTRLDRTESALNVPDGDKDTTTPIAMLGNLNVLLLGDALSPVSRALLLKWMRANTTGVQMLRAGLPAGWTAGDKTGHWMSLEPAKMAVNDIAIITPPGRKPLLVAAYTQGGSQEDTARVKVLASVGRIVADAFA